MGANRVQPTSSSVKTATLFVFCISQKDLLDAHTSDMIGTCEQCIKNCNLLSLRNDVEVELNFVHFGKAVFVHRLSLFFFFFNGALVLCWNFFPFHGLTDITSPCSLGHSIASINTEWYLVKVALRIKDHCLLVLQKPKW